MHSACVSVMHTIFDNSSCMSALCLCVHAYTLSACSLLVGPLAATYVYGGSRTTISSTALAACLLQAMCDLGYALIRAQADICDACTSQSSRGSARFKSPRATSSSTFSRFAIGARIKGCLFSQNASATTATSIATS
jgi:hypothetical protein